MTYSSIIKKVAYCVITLSCLFSSCNSETQETLDKTREVLPNGKRLVVEKTNKETTSTGIFTKHNYGTTHSYAYKISVNPGVIIWDERSGEPKSIIFCKDTTYIRYLKEKSIEAYTDATDTTQSYNRHYETQEFYQKHIDERYFFKLFGTEYWEEISKENYSSIKNSCEVYKIPNDNELSLKPVIDL